MNQEPARNFGFYIAYVVGLVLPLAVLAFGSVQILYRWNVRPVIESAVTLQARYQQPYIDDINFLSRVELLDQSVVHRFDAGPVLNRRLVWAPKPADFKLIDTGSTQSLVPPVQRAELLRLGNDWMEKNFRVRNFKADLTVFDLLEKFDFWDIEIESPIADLAAGKYFIPPPQLPIPDVADLLAAAKLRLMYGAFNKDATRSLMQVRELARLLMTTENIHLVLAGLAVLDEERLAYRYFVDTEMIDSTAWNPVDRNVTRRARRAILAARDFLQIWTPSDSIDQIYLGRSLPPGFCAAVNESLPTAYALMPLLKPHWPFEMDLKSNYNRMSSVFERAASVCRVRYLRELVRADNFSVYIPGPLVLTRMPYSRKVFGLKLSALNYDGFEGYK